ncbi:MAG: hypothetical protein K8R60_10460 [Burkholderiales bacterium]|nr:hypothetical protein [Burkholderiales bacterium]
MNSPSSLRLAKAAAFVGLACLSVLAGAADPGAKKPERRVPPTAQMGEIPAGVDAGTPTTSNSMQLGMPVPPSQQSADQAEQNRRSSAAARAAARPGPSAASNAYAKPIGPVVTTVQKKPPPAATATTAAKPASAPAR